MILFNAGTYKAVSMSSRNDVIQSMDLEGISMSSKNDFIQRRNLRGSFIIHSLIPHEKVKRKADFYLVFKYLLKTMFMLLIVL